MKKNIVFHDLKMEFPAQTGKVVRIYYSELMYVSYNAPYCKLVLIDKSAYNVESPLQYLMDNLPEYAFFQCNRSTILNLCCCRAYNLSTSMVVMENGNEFKLSRRKVKEFMTMKSQPRVSTPCPGCDAYKNEEEKCKKVLCRIKKLL